MVDEILLTETGHDAHDHTGVPGVGAGGAGLTFTPINRVTVINAATASATVSRTLTGAIAELPPDAVLATGYIDGFTNGAANTSNYMAVFHTSGGTADIAALLRLQMPSGLSSAVPFMAGVVHSSGAKLSYEVGRGANTITYNLYVTGYWAPA